LIVVDTSIISSLAKIGRLEMLKEFSDVWTTAGVVEEIVDSDISSVIDPLSNSLNDWVKTSTVVDIQRIRKIQRDYPSLSYVDSGLMIFCQKNDAILLTDDRKMLDVAEQEFEIDTYDLCEIFIALKNRELISEEDIVDIIEDLKKKDRYEFSEEDQERLTK